MCADPDELNTHEGNYTCSQKLLLQYRCSRDDRLWVLLCEYLWWDVARQPSVEMTLLDSNLLAMKLFWLFHICDVRLQLAECLHTKSPERKSRAASVCLTDQHVLPLYGPLEVRSYSRIEVVSCFDLYIPRFRTNCVFHGSADSSFKRWSSWKVLLQFVQCFLFVKDSDSVTRRVQKDVFSVIIKDFEVKYQRETTSQTSGGVGSGEHITFHGATTRFIMKMWWLLRRGNICECLERRCSY